MKNTTLSVALLSALTLASVPVVSQAQISRGGVQDSFLVDDFAEDAEQLRREVLFHSDVKVSSKLRAEAQNFASFAKRFQTENRFSNFQRARRSLIRSLRSYKKIKRLVKKEDESHLSVNLDGTMKWLDIHIQKIQFRYQIMPMDLN